MAHPAVLMGRLVGWCDTRFNRDDGPQAARARWSPPGLLLTGLALGWLIHLIPDHGLVEAITVAILIAQKILVEHVRAVATALRRSIPEGRQAVAMIVGRDTASMTGPDIARAAIESAAENLSDGVVAPVFWYLVARPARHPRLQAGQHRRQHDRPPDPPLPRLRLGLRPP